MHYQKYQLVFIEEYGYGMISNDATAFEVIFLNGNKKSFLENELVKLNDESKINSLKIKDIIFSKLFDKDLDIDIDKIIVNNSDLNNNLLIKDNFIQKIFSESRPLLIKIEIKDNLLLIDKYNLKDTRIYIAKLIKIARIYYSKNNEIEIKNNSLEEFNNYLFSKDKNFFEKFYYIFNYLSNLNEKDLIYFKNYYIDKERLSISLDEKTYLLIITFLFNHKNTKDYFLNYSYKFKILNYNSINDSYYLIKDLISSLFTFNFISLKEISKLDRDIKLILLSLDYIDINENINLFLNEDYSFEESKLILEKRNNFNLLIKIIFYSSSNKSLKDFKIENDDLINLLIKIDFHSINYIHFNNLLKIIENSSIKDNFLAFFILNKEKINPSFNELISNCIDEENTILFKIDELNHKNIINLNNEKTLDSLEFKILDLFQNNLNNHFNINNIFYKFDNKENYLNLDIYYKGISSFNILLINLKIDFKSIKFSLESLFNEEISLNLLNSLNIDNILSKEIINYFNLIKRELKNQNNSNFITSLNNYKNNIKSNIQIHLDLINNTFFHKIGIDKFYKITNEEFIKCFTLNKEKTFSKYYSFTFNKDNLDDISKIYLNNFYSFKDYELSNENLNLIFNIFKNNYVYIEEEKYKVTLTSLNKKIIINDDYSLSLENLDESLVLINNASYIINKNLKEINLFSNNNLINELVSLISRYNPNIKEYKEEFKYNVFLINEEHFILKDNSLKFFKNKELLINTYINLEKNNDLSLKYELLLNNNKVKEDELNNYLKNVLLFYKNILKELGFINNVIKKDNLLDFLKKDLTKLKNISSVYLDDKLTNIKVNNFIPVKFKSNFNNGLFNIIKENSIYSDKELLLIYNSLKENKNYVLLDENIIIDLSSSSLKEYKETIEDFNLIENNEFIDNKVLPIYYSFKNSNFNNSKDFYEFYDKFINELKNINDTKNIKLDKINASLRDYQKEAYNYLNILYKYNLNPILADDMGLGKTLEVVSFISTLNYVKPILIVTPTSLIFNWINEFNKFYPSQNIIPIYGSQKEREDLIFSLKNKIYITSYDTLRNDIELYKDISFDLLILDEAQAIKNSASKKSQSVKKINSDHKLVLTGTPIENSIEDLWNLFDFLMPGFLPNEKDFSLSYSFDDSYREKIKKLIKPFILKRSKKDYLKDLPSKTEIIYTSKFSSEELKIYDSRRLNIKKMIENNSKIISILGELTILRELCIDTSLVYDNLNIPSSKLDLMEELMLKEISNGNKVIIFSQFVKVLSKITLRLNKNNISFSYIDGSTKSEDRINICNDFNNNDTKKVCLISLKAGGTGLNLTGANVVIHIDPWWNYSKENQASDRVYRIGQTKNVTVYKLIVEHSIEEKVLLLQERKKELSNEILSNSDKFDKLSKDDLLYLLDL